MAFKVRMLDPQKLTMIVKFEYKRDTKIMPDIPQQNIPILQLE